MWILGSVIHGGVFACTVEDSMVKHTIEISSQPYHLSLSNGRLELSSKSVVCSSIPCDEIAMVVVDQTQTTYTHRALEALAESGAVVVICGSNHLPTSCLLPLSDHSELVWRLRDQIKCKTPRRKRLWQQIVKAKIKSQAMNLVQGSSARKKLLELSRTVASGDSGNVEAQAARIYWQNWLDTADFRRDQEGDGLNPLLNYGYAILRAAVARSIVAAGLTPMLGIHHRNRSNAFCLADDLMEPLRVFVDEKVLELSREGQESLSQPTKAKLLSVLTKQVAIDETQGPLSVAITRYVSSLVACFANQESKLKIPVAC
jgi:CRISPR-associated protein Cas1